MNQSVLGDRYRVEARIGAGGMAEVYRGFDPVLRRTVAIKTLLPQFARDAGFVSRFRREAQAAAGLNDPAIVGVYDTGADGDTQYIVMEFVEGRTLQEALSSGRRPTTMQAVDLAERIAKALGVAHRAGIVHRDIKPANVMVTRDGSVKVMDFGIARIQTVETAPQTSSVLGTPTYLSPEQAQGQPVDARSDIYSLGVLLYEMLAGRPPFTGDSPVAIAYKQVNEAALPPSTLNADVSPRLDAVVMKTLSKNPANRYQSADELAEDLERVRRGQEVEATPLLPSAAAATQVIARPQPTQVLPPPDEPKGAGRMWLGILIGVLVVALLAGAGYLLATSLSKDNQAEAFALPNVVGQQYDAAKSDLEGQGLVVTRTDKPSSKPEGQVLEQSPLSGTQVKAGDGVTLTVAVPFAQVPVPDLTNKTLDEATQLLTAAHLTLGNRTPASSTTVPDGQIFQQNPLAGTMVDRGTPVDVTYSTGPGDVAIGDYTCRTFASVKAELSKLGINAALGGTAPALSQCPQSNKIAAQDPAPGTPVPVGGTVTLFTAEEAPPTSPAPTGSPSP